MTAPSGRHPVGEATASEAAGIAVDGSEPAGTGPAANGSAGTGSAGTGSAGTGSAGTGAASTGAASTGGMGPASTSSLGNGSAAAVSVSALAGAGDAPDPGAEGTGAPATAAGKVTPAGRTAQAARTPVIRRPGQQVTEQRPYQPGPKWAWFLPPVLTFAVSLWGITTPSFWRDEAATIAAVRRPFGDLIKMLGNVDAVHSVYYMLMWPLVHVFGPGELVLRLPSALAISGAAAGVAAIGRRLISPWAGLAAGLLFAVLPVVSRYGQEGRSYAAVILVAVIASYFLVRVLGAEPGLARPGSAAVRWPVPPGYSEPAAFAGGPGPFRSPRRRWLVMYSASVAVLGMVNIFGLLLICGHAVTVALQYRRHAGDHAVRRLVAGWLMAVIAGVFVTSPLLVFGWMERHQIAWIAVNTPKLSTLLQLSGSFFATVAIVIVTAVALVVFVEASKEWRKSHWSRLLAELALPWLIVPPVALLAVSVISPIYTSRYILICVPPIALLGGAAIAALGRIGAPIAMVAIVLAGLPGTGGQLAVRTPYGHYDDIRGIDQIVAGQMRPGDVVLYTNPNAESFGSAYSYGLGSLPNIAQQQAAIPSGTLAGSQLSPGAISSRLSRVSRVWIVEINRCVSPPQLLQLNGSSLGRPALQGLPLHFVRFWHEHGDWLLLYAHGAGPQLVQPEIDCVPTTPVGS